MRKRILLVFLPLFLFAFGKAGAEGKKLTLMVYMCGSNLESGYGAASSDLREMVASGFDSKAVSVLVMTGGTSFWNTGFPPEELSICEVSSRGWRVVSRGESRSMGAAGTLQRLIDFGVEKFPAENYALILWDHGGGPLEGVCWDELFSMENLTLGELIQALGESRLPGKLMFIGFDACLMGSVEVASALSPYASYMIASQETEPSKGWNYAFLKGLETAGDGGEAGRRAVDAYFEGLADSRDLLTLSCVDLSRIEALEDEMDTAFGQAAGGMDRETFNRLSEIRRSSGDFGSPVRAAGEEGYDLTDLEGLAERIPGGEAVAAALSEAVVYSRSSEAYARGLSVYHPLLNKTRYAGAWGESYDALGFCGGYTGYIRRFAEMLFAEDRTDWTLPVPDTADRGAGVRLSVALSPEQAEEFSEGRLLILRRLIQPNSLSGAGDTLVWSAKASLSADRVLTADYSWEEIFVTDENGRNLLDVDEPVSYLLDGDGSTFILPGLYVTGDWSRTANVRHYFSREGSADELTRERTYVYDRAVGAYTNRIPFSEDEYDFVYFWRPLVWEPAEWGEIPGFPDWREHPGASLPEMRLPAPWQARIVRNRAKGTRLFAAFEVTDTRQNAHCTPLAELYGALLGTGSVQRISVPGENARAGLTVVRDGSGWGDPYADVVLEVKNMSGGTCGVTVGDFRINRKGYGKNVFALPDLPPGAGCRKTLQLSGTELERFSGIEEVSCTVTLRDPEDGSVLEELPLVLRAEDSGIR